MTAIPNVPMTEVPAASGYDPVIDAYPDIRNITVVDRVAPNVANQQPKQLRKRDETLRGKLNHCVEAVDAIGGKTPAGAPYTTDGYPIYYDRFGGGRAYANLVMGDGASANFKVTNLADPTVARDAVNKQFMEAAILAGGGSTSQSITGAGFIVDNAGRATVYLTSDGGYTGDATTPIVAGTVTGQFLWLRMAGVNNITVQNAGNCRLRGDWKGTVLYYPWLLVQWDGTYWYEVDRGWGGDTSGVTDEIGENAFLASPNGSAMGKWGVAVGYNAFARKQQALALGASDVDEIDGVGIDGDVASGATGSVAVKCSVAGTLCFGAFAQTVQGTSNFVAGGGHTIAPATYSTVIGYDSYVYGDYGINFGRSNILYDDYQTAIGYDNVVSASATFTSVVGNSNLINSSGTLSVVLGNSNTVSEANVRVLGDDNTIFAGSDGTVVTGDQHEVGGVNTENGFVMGKKAVLNTFMGQHVMAHAANTSGSAGDHQYIRKVLAASQLASTPLGVLLFYTEPGCAYVVEVQLVGRSVGASGTAYTRMRIDTFGVGDTDLSASYSGAITAVTNQLNVNIGNALSGAVTYSEVGQNVQLNIAAHSAAVPVEWTITVKATRVMS